MRSLLSFFFGVCAVLATVVTVPAMWVSHNVANEDGYVALAEPIARNTELHAALADAISDSLMSNTRLPAELQPTARRAIIRIANQVAGDPGFVTAWDDTQRRSHQLMLGDERGAGATFAIDLAPLGAFVVDRVNRNLPFTVPVPEQAVIDVSSATQPAVLDRIHASPTYARNGLIAIAVAVLLALAFARRRSVAVLWLGLGALAAAGLLKFAASTGVPEILDRNTAPSPFGKALLDVFVDRATTSFDQWLVVLAIGGGVAAAVGGVGRVVFSGRGRTSTSS